MSDQFVIGREPPEWVGATASTPIPERVKLRVFRRWGGRCYLTGTRINPTDTWEVEHILALGLGGANRESNLAPVLKEPHKVKTKADTRAMRKADRIAKKHLGITKRKGPKLQGRGFDKTRSRRMDGSVVSREGR